MTTESEKFFKDAKRLVDSAKIRGVKVKNNFKELSKLIADPIGGVVVYYGIDGEEIYIDCLSHSKTARKVVYEVYTYGVYSPPEPADVVPIGLGDEGLQMGEYRDMLDAVMEAVKAVVQNRIVGDIFRREAIEGLEQEAMKYIR